MEQLHALLIASYGRHYLAQRLVTDADGHAKPDGPLIQVSTPAKQHIGAVGDHMLLEMTSADQARIVQIEPRENLLYRSDAFKSKLIASNVDQILVVLATQPAFSPDLLGRAVVAAEANQIGLHILLNKCDLKDNLAHARKIIEPYARMGYPVCEVSAKFEPSSIDALRPILRGKVSVFVGQSGMGKSSLLNAWIPNAAALTQEYSVRLDTGKHTTTACRYFELPEAWGRDETGKLGALIDSPGFQEFGLAHMSVSELQHAFREFKDLLGKCRFHNCAHLLEPDCAVRAAVERNEIAPERLTLFRQLHSDSKTADVQIQGISQAKERWSALTTKPSKR
ncbi:ribosome small subunit-dependent GTPase A [Polynucleobacter sp. MWH-Braz-FAM2G]|uniref:ribosome small subunit-dependent GTPase A n=1 Tax=Polynucleobacter sp. MWH-Braz-FAM2G TaxID=1855883 RepID=UPI001BFDCC2F|nr:ribosome small subunit-dependent GTPase A [Polynucleobacter sp. MWH-Braz-FAM2G]QWD90279.1 ribosome small subunit-dependent GTPase A [Polynucleobacter sp. MWH-Braz-FAM2G]